MADIVNKATTQVTVNGEQAENMLTALEKKANKYKEAMVAANNVGNVKGYNKAKKGLQEVNREMNKVVRSSFDINKVMNNLSTTGPNQLKRALRELNKEFNKPHIQRGSKQYNELANKIKLVRGEITKLNAEQSVGQSFWSKASGKFNKHFAMLGTALASITGISLAFRKLSEDVAAMDDTYADVMKTTNMTREQVLDLNTAFKAMDTRTSREQLNLLARDAGKLGLQSREDILQFVEAGNIINVALGEDLGDGAIRNLGKLTDVYALSTKEMESLDLKGKMLAVGSAINELGASSTASEPYMLNFAQRLGGVASQAGISVQNILGYASALDQSGQAVEMSATAFQKFIMQVLKDPEKFARLAKLEVASFTNLLKTDTNAAIKQVLTSLSERGGFQQLIPVFQEMGLDGARAVGVLSALATNIKKVDEAQQISNDAFAEGMSVVDEYNIKNNNLQAKLEKARKEFKDQALALGEHLNPVLLKSTNLMTYVVKLMPSVIDFFSKYGKAILIAVAAIALYNIGAKLSVLQLQLQSKWTAIARVSTIAYSTAMALLSGNVVKATRMWRLLGVAIRMNPLGIALTIIGALVVAFYKLYQNMTQTSKATKTLQEAAKKYNEELATEQRNVRELFNAYKKTNPETEEHKKIRDIIVSKYGKYIQHLIDEKGNITDIGKALDIVNTKLREQIALKIRNEALNKIESDSLQDYTDIVDKIMGKIEGQIKNPSVQLAIRESLNKAITTLAEASNVEVDKMDGKISNILKGFGVNLYKGGGFFESGNIDQEVGKLLNKIKETNGTIVEVKNRYKGLFDELEEITGSTDLTDDSDNDNGTDPLATKAEQQRKTMQAVLRKLEIEHNEAMNKIKQDYLDGVITSESEYNAKLLEQQNDYDKKRIDNLNVLLDKGILADESVRQEALNQIAQFDQQTLDREIKRQAELRKILLDADPLKSEKEAFDKRLIELGLYGVRREDMTREQLNAFLLLEKQYQERVAKLERPEARMKIAGYNKDYAKDAESLAQYHAQGLLNERQYQHQLLLLDIAYTAKKLTIKELTEEQFIQLQRESQEKQRKLLEENSEIFKRLNKNEKLENLEEARDAELAFLDNAFSEDLQHTELYEQARLAIIQKYALLEEEQNKEKQTRMLEVAQFALDSLSTLMSSYSSYVQAANEAEVAAVNQKYDKLIKASKNNQKKVSQLEEQRDEELSEINRSNEERSFKIQIAQALASTAQSAINAYSSTAAIPIIGPTLAPIAAGVATAAGMLNVAAIKKQHDAAMANYWTGGYTPKGYKYGYAGNVHFGEFVGNAEAVRNPYANAVFDVVDVAQRNNTLSSLSPNDFVTALEYKERIASMPSRGTANASGAAPNQSNEELAIATNRMAEAAEKIHQRFDKRIVAEVYYKGRNGIEEVTNRAEVLDKNVKRS